MEQDGTGRRVSTSGQVVSTPGEVDNPDISGDTENTAHSSWARPQSTILTLQDLMDLPRQVLPEETYIHLRNAAREAALAAFTLWRSVDKARKGSDKRRTHIDVE